MRPSEARTITREQVFGMRSEGVFVIRGKGSMNEITRWSPRLEEVALAALDKWPEEHFPGPQLIRDHSGSPVSYSNYKSCRQRLIKRALELKLISESFTFHDIKAKGVSDHETKESGHKTEKMKAIYDRVPKVHKATR